MPIVSRISTRNVPPHQRLDLWEAYNAQALVGLKCSSFAEEGLDAAQDNLDLTTLRLADIRGNPHVIERPPPLIRATPKEAVFVSLILKSDAFFYQGAECFTLKPGELVLYTTDTPYLFGFTGNMRQLLFDVPLDRFQDQAQVLKRKPIRIGPEQTTQRVLLNELRAQALALLNMQDTSPARVPCEAALNVILNLLATQTGQPYASALAARYRLQAFTFIEEHLPDPELTATQVAKAVGLSTRHLSRLFAEEHQSVAHFILKRRLERTKAALSDPALQRQSVSEIAYRHGFSSQAHFSRVFRAAFGVSPSDVRAQAASVPDKQ
ncbi:AraC family transcriptional regulator [Pseudomonas duriflava]|uniref:AraC family transcriptional regulator n=1 Tax=Pseudomonas duriflava TaxID=459528 RepID=A0A562QDZ6_9PSED|nr:helix-turn-helix domain-containing protein [Pseudomonas duriflava]TWI54961.1 AraC family transcriptional regulator [Pseudomonas duriflava]